MRTAILGATASRLSSFFACLWMLMTVAQAADSPSQYLKGVTTVAYFGVVEDKGRCKIDLKAWNTAIDFVANQSTKLKLTTLVELYRQIDELRSNPSELFEKHLYMPRLFINITTIELESGCATVIEAEVKATLKPSTMISTGAFVPHPDFSIWSKTWTLQSPHQTFSRLAIETSERMMKEFVNDWTASQNLP